MHNYKAIHLIHTTKQTQKTNNHLISRSSKIKYQRDKNKTMKKAKSNKTTSEENGNKRYRIVFFGILLFVLVIFVVLTFITRDTLFLKYFHKDQLPYAILSVSFISLPILKLVSSSLKKYSLKKVAIGASGIISVVYFLFYSIISSLHEDDNSTTSHNSKNNNSQEYAKYIAGAFYVCSDIIVGIMLQIFWESVSSSFLLSDKKMSVNSINYGSTFLRIGTNIFGIRIGIFIFV